MCQVTENDYLNLRKMKTAARQEAIQTRETQGITNSGVKRVANPTAPCNCTAVNQFGQTVTWGQNCPCPSGSTNAAK